MSLLALQLLNKSCCVGLLWLIQCKSFENGKYLFCWWLFLTLACMEFLVCPFYQMLNLFWNVLDMFSEHLSCLFVGSSCYTGDTCNSLQVFLQLLFDHGICNTSCQGVNFCGQAFVGGHHWHLHPPSYLKLLDYTDEELLLSPQRFLLDRKPISMLYLLQYISCVDEFLPFWGQIHPAPIVINNNSLFNNSFHEWFCSVHEKFIHIQGISPSSIGHRYFATISYCFSSVVFLGVFIQLSK